MLTPIPAPRVEGVTASTPVPLYWREDGAADAPPIVLLHGGPGAHHDYLYPQMLALAKSHRVITYDQRGGGRSRTDDTTPITWQTQVADLAAVLHELELDDVPLVGYSWGGLLAMLYAIGRRREPVWPSISKLALISPAPISSEWRHMFDANLAARQTAPFVLQERAELAASGLRESDPAAYRQRAFELSVAGYFADPRKSESLTPFRVTARVQQSVWQSLGEFDLRDELRAVRLPVLVVHGRNDPIPLASSEAAALALDGRLVVLDECGHVPYVEQPEALFDAVLRFLA